MSNSAELVGKAVLVDKTTSPLTFGAFLAVARPVPAIDPKFFCWAFRSPSVQQAIRSTASQTVNIANISLRGLQTVTISIPPLSEQRRIVAEIEKQFSRLDDATAALERVKAKLKRARAAVLQYSVASVGDSRSIGSVVSSLDQGWSPRCERTPAAIGEWGVIKTTAIQPGLFLQNENKRLPGALGVRRHLELNRGDILVTRAGPRGRVGVACLVRDIRARLMNCDKVYRLHANESEVRPEYLELVLNTPRCVDQIDKLKTGISDSGVNLTQAAFLELRIPVPRIVEQPRIVAEVDRRLSVLDAVASLVDTNLARCARLRQSILKMAFEGRLVPQDPNDEPASVLFERLRARTASSARPSARRDRKSA
jgi:type I restriction enzyme S subunit